MKILQAVVPANFNLTGEMVISQCMGHSQTVSQIVHSFVTPSAEKSAILKAK